MCNTAGEYARTLEFLYDRLPMFQRIGAAAYRNDLSRIRALAAHLGHPEKKFVSVHIAGTNGKGSVSHMLASVFQASGRKTGLYTSPHLKDFRERIRIDGHMIPMEQVVDMTRRLRDDLEQQEPSFFEMTVAMAFQYFAEQSVDVAIVETGLGGRLDATNIIHPILSVITNISWDHADLLGPTLTDIAREKAGIIKAGVPVVVGEFQEETASIFQQVANEKRSLLQFASQKYQISSMGEGSEGSIWQVVRLGRSIETPLLCDLRGHYQSKNIATVLTAVEVLRGMGWEISEDNVRTGLSRVQSSTGLMGRWMVLGRDPLVVADTAHNEAGIRAVMEQVLHSPHIKLHIVWSMVTDKDRSRIWSLLPKNATYYFARADVPRGLDAEILCQEAEAAELNGSTYSSLSHALEAARGSANPDDFILISGSTFSVAGIL
ncbi:MAG: bifunctional folylpolyglutamate synthase/dihydrofolate synthase [Sphingomonadales bacterium]|nr:bifunctional folylpolyglutamate synthase/dihydrofolate synthase [Sphingomonadales bacterium]